MVASHRDGFKLLFPLLPLAHMLTQEAIADEVTHPRSLLGQSALHLPRKRDEESVVFPLEAVLQKLE